MAKKNDPPRIEIGVGQGGFMRERSITFPIQLTGRRLGENVGKLLRHERGLQVDPSGVIEDPLYGRTASITVTANHVSDWVAGAVIRPEAGGTELEVIEEAHRLSKGNHPDKNTFFLATVRTLLDQAHPWAGIIKD